MINQTPSKDLIRYDLLVQEALKGVVRKVLVDASRDGLPGDHHFYISFRTNSPGVRLSQRMREKYPEEMTIVLQHQFWDLGITEHTFEVGLSFSGIPERLLIPFDALVGFFDPSVQFGLKFELNGEAAPVSEASPAPGPVLAPSESEPARPRPALPLRGAASEPGEIKPAQAGPAEPRAAKEKAAQPAAPAGADESEDDKQSAQVVSLDAFRKKP
ncbi:MAG: ClpXP protease specificity-enhancing factor SspB [Hyphomicrobiales bacterium]|nr:ClpXP protease specificity-enhancing factor SspB [Hyphomicrobiales bacterium]